MLIGKENTLSITKTARYFSFGELGDKTVNIWFVCHGYGQLASYFIQKFEKFDPQTNFIVAPEALSKFYLNGEFTGRVGATWMTKEDRLNEIKDYINYLNEVYRLVLEQVNSKEKIKITVLGFSQAGATINRWVMDGKVDFHRLIVWAGQFPHDMDYEKAKELFNSKEIHYVYGTQDELIKETDFQAHLKFLNEKGISPILTEFEGKHEIDINVLAKFM